MQARELLTLTSNKLGNVGNRIDSLRLEVELATGLSLDQKKNIFEINQ